MRNTIGAIALGIVASIGVAAWLDGVRPLSQERRIDRRARGASRGARARHRAARGRQRDQEAAAHLRLLHRQAALVARRRTCSRPTARSRSAAAASTSGRERIREFLRLNGPESPQPKRLFDHMQLQPIVHVAADGLTAKGRWHVFAQEAVHGEYANWGLGVLENEYVKEGGVWKIRRHHFFTTMYTPYEAGWGKTAIPNAGPSAELPPDRPPTRRVRGVSRRRSSCRSTTRIP